MVRLRGAEDLHHAGQQPIDTGAHVDGLYRQSHGIDFDHRSSSRIHAAQSNGAAHGQFTLIVVVPRRSSIRMAAGSVSAGGNCTATKAVGTALLAAVAHAPPPRRSASRTQRRAKFELTPWAIATAAIDTPGEMQAATTCALNSALCVRRRRRPALTSLEIVCTCPPKTQWTRASQNHLSQSRCRGETLTLSMTPAPINRS